MTESTGCSTTTMQAQPSPFIPMTAIQRGCVMAAYLVFLLAVIFMSPQPLVGDAHTLPLLACYTALHLVPFMVDHRRTGWFHPLIFSSLLGLVDLLRRFELFAFGLESHSAISAGPQQLRSLIAHQLLLESVALIAYYFGYFTGPKPRVPRLRYGSVKRASAKCLLLVLVVFIGWALLILSYGGLSSRLATLAGGRHEELAGTYYAFLFVQLALPACLLWLVYHPRVVYNPLFWYCISATTVMLYSVSSSRAGVVYSLLIGLIAWMLRMRRIVYLRVIAMALLSIYLLTALGGQQELARQGNSQIGLPEDSVLETIAAGVSGELAARVTTSDGALPIYAYVPDDVPYLLGSSYIAVITLPVPRGLWPGKPGLIGGEVGSTFFGVPSGVPPGAVAEAYWNFDLVGVVAAFVLFGIFHNWLARVYRTHHHWPPMIVIYATTLVLFREPVTTALTPWLTSIILLAIVVIYLGGVKLRYPRSHVGH